jgi:hypothetical protein
MFQISALRRDDFDELFRLDDHELAARGAKRYRADRKPGFPRRVSLQDAEPGEQVTSFLIRTNRRARHAKHPGRSSFANTRRPRLFLQTRSRRCSERACSP